MIHALQIEALAHALSIDGVEAHAARLRAVASLAGRHGVEPVLIGVLLDPSAPEVARLRAFGRIATALARLRPSQGHGSRRSTSSGAAA